MAQAQAGGSGPDHLPDEDCHVPALHRGGSDKVPSHAGEPLLQVQADRAGLHAGEGRQDPGPSVGAKDRVVARFHGMRKLSEEYTSPTLGMFLEVGLRTQEAQEFWNLLHRLSQSAVWMVAGCYLRHERLHLSALAKRLAAVSR